MPNGDRDALAAALLDLVRDDGLRRRMGGAALENSSRYGPGPVVEQAEALFTELAAARAAWPPGRPGPRRRPRTGPRGYAARDTALAAAGTLLRTVRKAKR